MRVLVTGGAGFIGRRAVDLLLRAGHAAAVVDDLSVGLPMPPPACGLTTARIDVRDAVGLTAFFTQYRPEVVIHLAAIHHIPTCERRRADALAVNVVGTENVLAAAETATSGLLVAASSGAVYDPAQAGFLQENGGPVAAADNYALSKLTNERQAAFWSRRAGATARIARIFNAVGCGDPNGHLIPDILRQLGSPPQSTEISLGNVAARRDYVHADDIAAALVAMALDPQREQETQVYNICTGQEHSVPDLLAAIGAALDIRIDYKVDAGRLRAVDRPSQLGDPSKTAARFGWRARYGFAEAVRRTVRPESGQA